MFSTKLDALLLSLSAQAELSLFPPYEERKAWSAVDSRRAALFEARARRAMDDGIPRLYLSDAADLFENGKRIFEDGQTVRREQLKAIALHCLTSGGDLNLFARMADLIYEICEEAFWGPPEAFAGLSEGRELNGISLSTAGLLASAAYLFKEVEMPAFNSALSFSRLAVNARVLKPFLKREDSSMFRVENALLPCAVEHVLTAALVLCSDDHERWLCVRKAVSYLDQYLIAAPGDGSYRTTLEAHVDASASLSFCVDLIIRACNYELEFRSDKAFRTHLHLPCALHIVDKWFINSGSGSMLPELSPDALFEMARFIGDQDLMGLSAALGRLSKDSGLKKFTEISQPLLREAHQALILAHRFAQPAREPVYEDVALPELGVYAKRAQGFYAALNAGAREGHPSSGNFILFYEGEPLFIDADGLPATQDHTLPTVDGAGQSPDAGMAGDASREEKGVYSMISMNIAPAYEKRADLLSWQRTILFTPMERGVRLMEVYDFDTAEHLVKFHFITPHKPVLYPDKARVGPATLIWEGEMEAQAARLPCGMQAYRLTLSRGKPSRGGSETFIIKAS